MDEVEAVKPLGKAGVEPWRDSLCDADDVGTPFAARELPKYGSKGKHTTRAVRIVEMKNLREFREK